MLKLDCGYKFDIEGLMFVIKFVFEFVKMFFLGNRQNSFSVVVEEGNKDFIFYYVVYIFVLSFINCYGRWREM